MPTSVHPARRMASVINPASGLPVLELGAGTGVITKAILETRHQAASADFDRIFQGFLPSRDATLSRRGFSIGRCVRAVGEVLAERSGEQFDCVISAVPLLSFPMEQRVGLLEDLLARIPRGRPVIQITYGPLSPVIKMPDRYVVSHYDFIVRNIPPAQLWTYRRAV